MMNAHNCKRSPWSFSWRLVLVVLVAMPFSLLSTPNRVEAAGGVSAVIPFAGVLAGWRGRNRIYRTANAYMEEKREYYDRLRAKAKEQLEARQIGGLRDSQVAAYVKVVGLIEGERQAMIDYAESEKRAARAAFIEQVERAIVNRMLGSTAVTRVLGALAKGVRSSQDLIDGVLEELSGGGSGALADVQRARRIGSRMTIAGQLIGGNVGRGIRNAGARIVAAIDRPTGEIQAGLEQVRGELGELGAAVSDLQARGVTLTASQVTREVAVKVVTGEQVDPAVEAIVSLLAGKAGREGGTFRGRARSALIGNFVARCAAIGKRYREAVARLEGEAAGAEMSDEQSISICNAIDLDQLAEEVQATSQAAMLTATPEELGDNDMRLTSLVVDPGWCFPKDEHGDTHHCLYSMTWEIEYRTTFPPARIICYLNQVDIYSGVNKYGTTLEESGVWTHTLNSAGFYTSLGEHTETLSCELREGDFETGNLHASFEMPVTISLATGEGEPPW
jgi:hypothetical protein